MTLMESYSAFIYAFRNWLTDFNRSAGPVHVDIVGSGSAATLESITSERKHQGYASQVMTQLCELADQYGVTIQLQPVSYADYGNAEGGLSMDALIMWYEQYNFELDFESGWMRRRPST
jgi:hypothetical protein